MLTKVISGGQIGADRMGLEAARELGLATGGTAPLGYRTSKGSDPSLKDFGLSEDASPLYPPRTMHNVTEADGTVIFAHNINSPGVKLTIRLAQEKPLIVNPSPEDFAIWVRGNGISTVNVAGNRSWPDQNLIRDCLAAALT